MIPTETAYRWQVVGTAQTGRSHQAQGEPCFDSYAVQEAAHNTLIIAVADGAGTLDHARLGATLSTQTVTRIIAAHLSDAIPTEAAGWQSLMRGAFTAAHDTLTTEAGDQLFTHASTLIVLVLAENWTVCGSIGDCVAVVDTGDALVSPCPPQKGEYANETNFITQADALDQLDIQVRAGCVRSAAVLSDGLLALSLNVAENRPHAPFFAPLFQFAAEVDDPAVALIELNKFLESERVNRRTDDDKTLILAHRT